MKLLVIRTPRTKKIRLKIGLRNENVSVALKFNEGSLELQKQNYAEGPYSET